MPAGNSGETDQLRRVHAGAETMSCLRPVSTSKRVLNGARDGYRREIEMLTGALYVARRGYGRSPDAGLVSAAYLAANKHVDTPGLLC